MQLMLREVDLGGCALEMDEPRPHRHGHLIQIAHLSQNFVGDRAQGKITALVHCGTLMTGHQLRLRQRARGSDHFVGRAPRNDAANGDALILPRFFGEPEAADVLDPIVGNDEGNVESPIDCADRRDLPLDRIFRLPS